MVTAPDDEPTSKVFAVMSVDALEMLTAPTALETVTFGSVAVACAALYMHWMALEFARAETVLAFFSIILNVTVFVPA
jgi:hypothetical protein